MLGDFNFNNATENYSEDDLFCGFLAEWTGSPADSLSWPLAEVRDMVDEDPERAWRLILRLSDAAPNIECESILAAGPIEEFLSKHGAAFIERVEQQAAKAPKFNHIFGGVWRLDMDDEVRRRVQAARSETW